MEDYSYNEFGSVLGADLELVFIIIQTFVSLTFWSKDYCIWIFFRLPIKVLSVYDVNVETGEIDRM